MQKIKLFYIGTHPHTLVWINQPPYEVHAISQLDFFYRFTLNLGDILFQITYFLHTLNKFSQLKQVCFFLWKLFQPLNSSVYKRYATYLSTIITARITVLDVDDSEEVRDFINNENTNYIVVNVWSLLPSVLTSIPHCPVINVHPSRLPQYRGALPTLWSLKNGDSSSAVTFLVIDQTTDGGEILAQYEFPIAQTDFAIDLEKKIEIIVKEHLLEDLEKYHTGQLKPFPQKGEISVTGKYGQYRAISWQDETARDIVNKVTLYPYLEPFFYCQTYVHTKVVEVLGATVASYLLELSPGEFRRLGGKLLVGTRSGNVALRLFKDLPVKTSLGFLMHRRGRLKESVLPLH